MFKNIINIWNNLKKDLLEKKDLFYIEHFFNKCKPILFKDGILEFEVASTTVFNELKKIGIFNKLKEKIPEIKKCKVQKININNIIVGKFNKSFVDVVEQMLNKNFKFSPVFVHSEPGLGKTFILENAIEASKKSEISIKYYHTNDFIKDIYEFFYNKNIGLELFKKNLKNNYDLIFFDDIQFLSGKEKISDIFFQIINNKKTNFIFSADVHPEELININKRIISRLQHGIVLKIDIPDIETGYKIVEEKIKLLKFPIEKIDKNVKKQISEKFRQDLRKLNGVINKIVFNFNYKKNFFCISDLQILLNNYKFYLESKITSKKIIKIITSFYGLSSKQLTSKQRNKKIVIAKYMAMYLIKELRNETHETIAKIFKAKNHTTTVNGIKKFRQTLKLDDNLKNELKEIKKKCLEF